MVHRYLLILICLFLCVNYSCTNDFAEEETAITKSPKLLRVDQLFNNKDIGNYLDYSYDETGRLKSIYENYNFMPFSLSEFNDSIINIVEYAQNPMLSTIYENYNISYDNDLIILRRGNRTIEVVTTNSYIDYYKYSDWNGISELKFVRDDENNIISIRKYVTPTNGSTELLIEYFFSEYSDVLHPDYFNIHNILYQSNLHKEIMFLLNLKITKHIPLTLNRFILNNITQEMEEEIININILNSEDNSIHEFEGLPVYNSLGNFSYKFTYE